MPWLISRRCLTALLTVLSGKLSWFPEMLSDILDSLKIDIDDAPLAPDERILMLPNGIFSKGNGMQVCAIPIVDWADAATGIECFGGNDASTVKNWNIEHTETVPAPVGNRRQVAFRVAGQSMDPAIRDGEVIFCDPAGYVQNGKIVVVKFCDCAQYPECIVCKRYRQVGKLVLLTSDNPEGKEYTVTPDEIEWMGLVTGKYCGL